MSESIEETHIDDKDEFSTLKRRPSLKDLTPKQFKDYKSVFEMFDKNRDGVIDVTELENILKAIGHKPTQNDVMDVFRDVDKNQDGKIEFREFIYLMKHSMVVDELSAAFNLIDTDKDGLLSFQDIKDMLKMIGEHMSDSDIRTIVKQADLDQDGYINFVEFSSIMNSIIK